MMQGSIMQMYMMLFCIMDRRRGEDRLILSDRFGFKIGFLSASMICYCSGMDRIAELASAIDEEKALRAREATVEEKLLDGPRLFRQACEQMRAGIRITHPEAEWDLVNSLRTALLALDPRRPEHAAVMESWDPEIANGFQVARYADLRMIGELVDSIPQGCGGGGCHPKER